MERVSKVAAGVVVCGLVITVVTVVKRERSADSVHSPRSKSCREVGVVHNRHLIIHYNLLIVFAFKVNKRRRLTEVAFIHYTRGVHMYTYTVGQWW